MAVNRRFTRVWPLFLAVGIILLDQASKWFIVRAVPLNTVGWELLGDFLRIIHVRNLGIVFSIGNGLPSLFRRLLFVLLPLAVLFFLSVYYLRDRNTSRLQRWAIAGIIGGGMGNILDRIFRPYGVVDFIDVKFFGIFGLNRFPTFNFADSSVVICGILLVISFFQDGRKTFGWEAE